MRARLLVLVLLTACTTATPTTSTIDTCEDARRLFGESFETLNQLIELEASIDEAVYRDPVYAMSILVEQNPSCFSVDERLGAELWRQAYDAAR